MSYAGATAPTGQKPQSKLWYNDGIWWGSLFNTSTRRFEIYKFNWQANSWSTTGVVIDSRSRSSADALWDGAKLYIVSAVNPGSSGDLTIRVMRYSYNPNTTTYSMDTGFPVTLASSAIETVVMDKDTTGKLWVTYTDTTGGGRSTYVTHSTTNDATWISPYILPVAGANNLTSDDISTIVAYNGKIGVMWSNQTDNAVYFATHIDGDPDGTWSVAPALQGPKYADDHLNIKSLRADAAGQVFAAVKTSLNDVGGDPLRPLILLLTLDNQGSWSRRTVATVADNHTRPIVLIDNENRTVYVFLTVQYGTQTSGAIYVKSASLDNPSMQFPNGLGTPFIEYSAYVHINNATSTKQSVNSTSNLLVIAGDDNNRLYFHNVIDLGPSGPTATSTNTPTSTATALPTNTPTSTSTPLPTNTPTNTALPTDTPTATPNWTPTNTAIPTDTPTATNTPLPTDTPTPTPTPLPTFTPTPTSPPVVIFSDGFEGGSFANWSQVVSGGDGFAAVQSSVVRTGIYAAQFYESANTGSVAYAHLNLANTETALTFSGDFMITADGSRNSHVPIFRIYDPAGNRLINLYRQNGTKNEIWVSHSNSRFRTTGLLPLNTWGHFEIYAQTAGLTSTIRVYLNGTLIYETLAANLGTTGMQGLQLGNDSSKQVMNLYVDNIEILR